MDRHFSLSVLDLASLCAYVGVLLCVALWPRSAAPTAQAHFLAQGSGSWFRIGAALYASTLGATSLTGLTGSAYAHGISVFAYEWMPAFILPVFCAFILPTYLRTKVFTVPEFFQKRYGTFARNYVSFLSVGMDVFVHSAGGLFAGSMLLSAFFPGANLMLICLCIALIATVFLFLGGLRVVILIESIQGIIIVSCCACIAYYSWMAIGGWQGLVEAVPPERLKLVMPANDKNLPWMSLVTGVPLIGFYYWCTNQKMVQRVLSAKTIDHGRWGSLFGAALKLSTLFLVIIPGAAAAALFPGISNPDKIFAYLVFDILPEGWSGLILGACAVSMLSSLAAAYNASSTIITMDFVRRLNSKFDEKTLIYIGRVIPLLFMCISMMWAPNIGKFNNTLWQYLQSMVSYFVPPVAAIFLAGLLSNRTNATGAAWGLTAGTISSFTFFLSVEVYHLASLHFHIASVIIFGVALVATAAGSLMSPSPPKEETAALTFSVAVWHTETEALKGVKFYQNYRVLSIALISIALAILFWFW